MKKAFSLLFIIVVLLSGMTLRYSEHYCQGTLVASKLSLTGDNAGCGMNREENENGGMKLSNLMCVNEIFLLTFSDNYVYSTGTREAFQQLQSPGIPYIIAHEINLIPSLTELRKPPPGGLSHLRTESEVLCVFRI